MRRVQRGQVYLGSREQMAHFVVSNARGRGAVRGAGVAEEEATALVDTKAGRGGGRRLRVVEAGGGPRKAGLTGRPCNIATMQMDDATATAISLVDPKRARLSQGWKER